MEKMEINFRNHLNYILINLEEDLVKANNLEDQLYLEMSKDEIINSLNNVYKVVKCWEDLKQYEKIINEYSEIESIISELELCLADYEREFHMDGISYSLFQIGHILSSYKI